MRRFEIHNINEMSSVLSMDNKPHYRFGYEQRLAENLNPILLANFQKVCKWVKETYPNLNCVIPCKHDVYYMLRLAVENGEAILETGSWGGGFSEAIGATFSEAYSQGSCQGAPYRFIGTFAFRNDRLEEFLSQWASIKAQIISKGNIQNEVFSEDFAV